MYGLDAEATFQPHTVTAARLAVDLGIFKALALQSPRTAEDLRKFALQDMKVKKVDESFIIRTMRLITFYNLAVETAPNTYAANTTTLLYGEPNSPMESLLIHMYEQYVPVLDHSISYFAENGYEMPSNPHKGPFQSYWQTEKTTYDYWVDEHPHVLQRLSNFMKAVHSEGWYEWMDVPAMMKKHLRQGQDSPMEKGEESRLLLVDVGGGNGTSLLELRTRLEKAGVKGVLMLQEQESVIADAVESHPELKSLTNSGSPYVRCLVHDFFEPQPAEAQGALYYYMRHIMHNWNDESCVKILKQCTAGMRKGYSRLLINERVVKPMGNGLFTVAHDVHMAYSHAARERTLEEFENLMGRVGMEVVEYHQAEGEGAEDVIECMLV